MKCEGYKISGYDATYHKTLFNVNDRSANSENRVLEITDVNSGITFLVDLGSAKTEGKKRIGKWQAQDVRKDHQGTSVTFGSKGLLEELKHSGKKLK